MTNKELANYTTDELLQELYSRDDIWVVFAAVPEDVQSWCKDMGLGPVSKTKAKKYLKKACENMQDDIIDNLSGDISEEIKSIIMEEQND
jgi:hypothetical protein